MTRAPELAAAIEAGDAAACARVLAGLTEPARRELYRAVSSRLEVLDTAIRDYSRPREELFKIYPVARIALLGVGTLGELKKASAWVFSGASADAAVAVLLDRHPVWLPDWAEFELTRSFRTWSLIRMLVRSGALPRPATEFYILGMIAAANRNAPRVLLEQDPSLLKDELWSLFEHEGSGELSLAAYDKYVPDTKTWATAFCELVAENVIDRSRVLAASLDALQRDFAPFRAGWFSRLHEALKPTKTERAELSDRYFDLLNSRVPATVSFAMKALTEAHKAGAFDVAGSAPRLAPAFEARDKGTVMKALGLVKKALPKCDAAAKATLVSLAARALSHESPEVQTAALDLTGDDPSLLEPYRETLAASVRARLGENRPVETTEPRPESSNPSAVAPISKLDELVETFAAILENQGPPIDIERVLEAVARVGIPAVANDAGFARLTAALAKRSETVLSRQGVPQPRAALAVLALAWARGHRVPSPPSEKHLADFMKWRLWCLSEQAAQRIEHPLLSLPGSPEGRIEATELDRRMAALTPTQAHAAANPESLFHLDLQLARLRAYGTTGDPHLRLVWSKETWTVDGKTYSYYSPALEGKGLPAPSRFEPAALTPYSFFATPEMKRWCATVSPRWLEGWFAAGCRDLGANIDWHEANWSTRAYLEPLLNPLTAIGEMGAMLIALGLGAKETGEAGLAVDALIAAATEQRLDPAALGQALTGAAASGAIKFSRWAKRLQQAAQAGAAPSRIIFLALESLFESGNGGGDFARLIELELELAHMTGLRITRAGAISALQTATGKSAQALLELSSPG